MLRKRLAVLFLRTVNVGERESYKATTREGDGPRTLARDVM